MRGAGRNQPNRPKGPGKPNRQSSGNGADRYGKGNAAAGRANRANAPRGTDKRERTHTAGESDRFTTQGRSSRSAGRSGPATGGVGTQGRASRAGGRSSQPPGGFGTSGSPNGRPSRGADRHAQQQPAAMLKLGRRKGEWIEFRLPDALAGAPVQQVMKHTPLSPKLVSKLLQTKGLLLQGTTLRLALFPREKRDFPPDWMELNVLYEDDFTLVVNKPAGYEVHPSEKGQRHTLAHAVAAYYEMTNQDVRIRHIHRIDKETTGPVLYAKNEFAHYQYDKEMREKQIERIYLALAEGELAQDRGTIDKPIGQDRHHSTRRRVSETGDPAVTHYEVVERFDGYTLVRLRLETGRTHQIRVHMAAIGHPLAGDGLYGGKRAVISRQALHGERLIWHHPWTGEKLSVRAPLPDDFSQALDKLRRP